MNWQHVKNSATPMTREEVMREINKAYAENRPANFASRNIEEGVAR